MQSADRILFDTQASFQNVRPITNLASIKLVADMITNTKLGSYEYQASTLGTTMLIKAFHEDHWVFTPESRFGYINRQRPDLMIQNAQLMKNDDQGNVKNPTLQDYEQGQDMFLGAHIIYEAKSRDSSDRLEDALEQAIRTIPTCVVDGTTMFIVIQKGLSFAFFEYYYDQVKLDELKIPNFRGAVPITAEYQNSFGETELFFPDVYYKRNLQLLPLFHDSDRLIKVSAERTTIRQ